MRIPIFIKTLQAVSLLVAFAVFIAALVGLFVPVHTVTLASGAVAVVMLLLLAAVWKTARDMRRCLRWELNQWLSMHVTAYAILLIPTGVVLFIKLFPS